MKSPFASVLVSYKGEVVEQLINLNSVSSISPYIEVDDFDNYCASDCLTEITFNNGNFIVIKSSYKDFINKLFKEAL